MSAALYLGRVMHARFTPKRYRFDYRVFSLLFDVDRLDALHMSARLLSVNRFNLFSFHEQDHGAADGSALGPWARELLARHGVDLDGGRIHLLCFPRVLGFVFNPLSVWYCVHRDGTLRAIIFEVRNTFGERHCYLVRSEVGLRDGDWHEAAKEFHVSPFLPMPLRYRFRVEMPGRSLSVVIDERDANGARVLLAALRGMRHAVDDAVLLRCFLSIPAMTLKVVAAIHWQAMKLWLRGFRFHRKPPPPADEVTPAWHMKSR